MRQKLAIIYVCVVTTDGLFLLPFYSIFPLKSYTCILTKLISFN